MTAPVPSPTNFDLLIVLTRIEERQKTSYDLGVDHEARLRTMEKRLWQLPSVATVLAAVGTGTGLLALFR